MERRTFVTLSWMGLPLSSQESKTITEECQKAATSTLAPFRDAAQVTRTKAASAAAPPLQSTPATAPSQCAPSYHRIAAQTQRGTARTAFQKSNARLARPTPQLRPTAFTAPPVSSNQRLGQTAPRALAHAPRAASAALRACARWSSALRASEGNLRTLQAALLAASA